MPPTLSNRWRERLDNCTLFAQPCALCHTPRTPHGLCPGCRACLTPLPAAHCPRCAEPYSDPHAPCGHCQRHPPAFDALHAALLLDYPLLPLLHTYKYAKQYPLGRLFARLLGEATDGWQAPGPGTLVIPVPLAPARLAERGFNQCHPLAKALAARMQGRFEPRWCWRKRNTAIQARLDRQQRQTNLADAFGVDHRIAGHSVVLVDDVATTCATLNSLAASLKKAGAKRVDCWVLARAARTPI